MTEAPSVVKSIADNVWTMLAARVVQLIGIPALGALLWFGQHYLDNIRDAADKAAISAQTANSMASELKAHVDVIDMQLSTSSQDRSQFQDDVSKQQDQLEAKVDKLTDVSTTIQVQVSAISATLDAIRREQKIATTGLKTY